MMQKSFGLLLGFIVSMVFISSAEARRVPIVPNKVDIQYTEKDGIFVTIQNGPVGEPKPIICNGIIHYKTFTMRAESKEPLFSEELVPFNSILKHRMLWDEIVNPDTLEFREVIVTCEQEADEPPADKKPPAPEKIEKDQSTARKEPSQGSGENRKQARAAKGKSAR